MIKAIIFDFFGVIGQSTYALINDYFELTDEQNVQLRDLHKSLDYEFITQTEFIKAYADVVGITEVDMQKIYHDSNQRFGTSAPLLEYIKNLRIHYRLALLSNVSREAYKEFFEPVLPYFDVVVTSYHSKLAKPEKAIFKYTAVQLGIDVSECIMIDDNQTNCQGAMAAGMQAILYQNTIQLKRDLTILLKE